MDSKSQGLNPGAVAVLLQIPPAAPTRLAPRFHNRLLTHIYKRGYMKVTGSLAIVLVQFGGRAIPERYIIPTAIGIQAATVVRLVTAAITRLTMDVTIRAVADLLAELAAAAPSVTVLVPILATNATTSQ